MKTTGKNVRSDCDACTKGKMCEYTNGLRDERAKDLVHCDLAGPAEPCSFGNKCRYAVTFVDDYSNLICIYFIRSKDHAVHTARNTLLTCRLTL